MMDLCSVMVSLLYPFLFLFSYLFFLTPQEMKEQGEKRKRKGREDEGDDAEHSSGVRKKVKGGKFVGGRGRGSRRGR